MNLTIRQLETFRQVMRTGTISEAARALNRTQPAVSAAITSLEQELGLELFERQRGRLIKRPEAEYFLDQAELILEQLANTARTLKEIAQLESGRLKIACMPASSQFFLPRLVAGFVADKPEVKVSLMMRASSVIEQWIASQQYDVGLAETPAENRAISQTHFELPCVCAVPVDDPLAKLSVITPSDLDGLPLAVLQEDHPTLLATQQAFSSHSARLNPRFELRNFQPALTLVEEGLCYCICDPLTATSYLDYQKTGQALTFKPFTPRVDLSIAILQPAHRPPSQLAEAFITELTAALEQLARGEGF